MIGKLVILLIGLTLAADAFLVEIKDPEKGFEELDNYLMKNLADNPDPEENLALARKRLNKSGWRDAMLKKAIGALDTISSSRTCSYDAIQELDYALKASLDLAYGERRVETVMRFYAEKMSADCNQFFESEYNKIKRQFKPSDPVLALKSDYLSVSRGRAAPGVHDQRYNFAAIILGYQDFFLRDSYVERIYEDLVDLAKDDADNKFYGWEPSKQDPSEEHWVKHTEKIRNAFNKYLVPPCKAYNSKSDELFNAIATLAHYYDKFNVERGTRYLADLPDDLKVAMYHNRRCSVVLTMKDDEINSLDGTEFHREWDEF